MMMRPQATVNKAFAGFNDGPADQDDALLVVDSVPLLPFAAHVPTLPAYTQYPPNAGAVAMQQPAFASSARAYPLHAMQHANTVAAGSAASNAARANALLMPNEDIFQTLNELATSTVGSVAAMTHASAVPPMPVPLLQSDLALAGPPLPETSSHSQLSLTVESVAMHESSFSTGAFDLGYTRRRTSSADQLDFEVANLLAIGGASSVEAIIKPETDFFSAAGFGAAPRSGPSSGSGSGAEAGYSPSVETMGMTLQQCQKLKKLRQKRVPAGKRSGKGPDIVGANGRLIRSHGVYSDWVLELGTKERNLLIKANKFGVEEKRDLVARARQFKQAKSHKKYRQITKKSQKCGGGDGVCHESGGVSPPISLSGGSSGGLVSGSGESCGSASPRSNLE